MMEMSHSNLEKIEIVGIHARWGHKKNKYILLSVHYEGKIDTEKSFANLFFAINKMLEKHDVTILYSCHPRSRMEERGSCWTSENDTLIP